LEVLREVKSCGGAISVIVLTNHSGPAFREACERQQADFFFDKATEFESVREVLQELAGAG
jgi:CheY-like chemotaxis protein